MENVFKDVTYHLPWVGVYRGRKCYFATKAEASLFANTGEML